MDHNVQVAWIGLAAQVVGVVGGLLAVIAAIITHKTRREQDRLRQGFLALADERRRELWEKAEREGLGRMVQDAVEGRVDIAMLPEPARELAIRKYRIDHYRDEEWNAAGRPRGKATGRPI